MKNKKVLKILFLLGIFLLIVGIIFIFKDNKVDYYHVVGEDSISVGSDTYLSLSNILNKEERYVSWLSDTPEVATIDNEGNVRGIKPGTAKIRAITLSGKIIEHIITVYETTTIVEVTDINITGNNTIKIGETTILNTEIVPSNATDKSLTWVSTDKNIADVKNGKVTGITSGFAVIKAMSKNGIEKYFVVEVLSEEESIIDVESIEIKGNSSINVGEYLQLSVDIKPIEATNKNVIWLSSDESIAKIDANGNILGLKEGTCTITAFCDNKEAKKTITVKKVNNIINVEKVKIKGVTEIDTGKSSLLSVEITPSNATYKDVTWESVNKDIITITNDGTIVGIKEGIATIKATVDGITDTVMIKVNKVNNIIKVNSITLYGLNYVDVGKNITLSYIINPTNATNQNVIWESSDNSIAKVNNGIVIGIKEGSAIIKATVDGKYAEKAIEVKKNVVIIPATGIKIEGQEEILEKKTYTLKAVITPSDATNKDVIWTSSNTSVATVNNGIVNALKPGTTVITAKVDNISCTKIITVKSETIYIPVTEVEIFGDGEVMENESITLTATVSPSNATNKEVIWKSSDTTIATVNNGVVTAIKPGTAIISVEADGKSNYKAIIVKSKIVNIPVNSITISGKDELIVDESTTLTATVSPTNATNKEIIWTSSNPSVATVNNGVVKALKVGTTLITATADGKSSSLSFTVNPKPISVESIKLDGPTEVFENNNITLIATITPSNATNKNVSWISSNTSVATVNKGVVTGIKEGKTTITATVDSKTATITVNVKKDLSVELYASFGKNGATSQNGSTEDWVMLTCRSDGKNGCTIKTPQIERNGYEILGYSTNYNSKTAEYAPNQTITIHDNKLILYAITRKTVTLSYDRNGASGSMQSDSCTMYNGEAYCLVQVKSNSFTNSNGIFLNWSDDTYKFKGYENNSLFKRILRPGDNIQLKENKTIKAYWLNKLNNSWPLIMAKSYDNNYNIRQDGQTLTGAYNNIQLRVLYVDDKNNSNISWLTNNGEYKYIAYFYAWVDAECNYNTDRFHYGYNDGEILTGGDSIYLARSKSPEGPWEVYSRKENGEYYFEKRMTREGALNWYMVVGSTFNSGYDTQMVGDPSVVYKDGKFYMAYSGCGLVSVKKSEQSATEYMGPYVICGAWSTDGIHWTKLGQKEIWQFDDTYTDRIKTKGAVKPIAKWWNEDDFWSNYYKEYKRTGIHALVYLQNNNFKGGYQRPTLMWDSSINKWKVWFDGSNGNTGYMISKTSDFITTGWNLYAEYETTDYNKVYASTVDNDTAEINKAKIDFLPIKWSPFLNASMYYNTMPDSNILKVGNKYYAAATPYINTLDKFGSNRLLYNPKVHNPNYNVMTKNPYTGQNEIDIAWPGRQITMFESNDGLSWNLLGYFEPDPGSDASQVPELFYDKQNNRICLYYSVSYGTYGPKGNTVYDWSFYTNRMRCKAL